MSRSRRAVRHKRWLRVAAAAIAGGALVFAFDLSADAEPATSVAYPSGATATRYSGLAFDTCTAPSLSAIQAWKDSPYRAVGVYIGGVTRTCAQPQLTASWVAEVSKLQWKLLPIYKGLQPSCGARATDPKISLTSSTAASQGKTAADDAIAQASALGMLRGSAFYNDIEFYSRTDTVCRTSVLTYLSAWTKQLHARGYLSGVYMNLNNGAKDLSDVYDSTSYARPDALWVARYDGIDSLAGFTNISDLKWANHQRAKQFLGDHTETWGGVTLSVDRDRLDAPVATVPYTYKVTSGTAARTGPSSSSTVVRTLASGSSITVACQAPGSAVGTTSVWDKLADGTYVPDYYVSTASNTTYTKPLPRCTYPWQVSGTASVNLRTGPGTSYTKAGTLPGGALAWVVCQSPGSLVSGTRVWDKLDTGRWVTDHYVANASNTTYSKPAPRCK